MHPNPSKSDSRVSYWMIFALASALAVIGAKCWMIAKYGSPTPFWDQWDAEGAILYPKYFDGTLNFSDLIAPHNEHRILVTRLWSLLLLELGGYWDPILQMLANTLILGAFVTFLVVAFRPILDDASWIAFALFSTVIYALPFGWESTLAGFHSQWYFMLLISIAGLVAIAEAAAFTPRWWIALLLLLMSYFCIASGALTLTAAFAACAVQFVVGRRSGLTELLALAILAAMTVAMVLGIPVIAGHASLKAHSIGQFLRALLDIASWPAPSGNAIVTLILGATIVQGPALLTSVYVILLRPPIADRRWLLVALTGWATLQAAAVAYGRAVGPTSSRYLDVFAIGVLLNWACLLYLLRASPEWWQRRRIPFTALAFWLLLVLVGAAVDIVKHTMPDLAGKQATGRAETANLRTYLDSGDISALENKPFLDIPYPNAKRLATIVSQPVIRALLPPALVGDASAARAQQRGLARFTGRPIETLKNYTLRWGVLLIPTGLTLFLLGLTMGWWRTSVRRHEQPHGKPAE